MAGRLPLAGVRILDLSDEAVVLAGRLLADLGAGVVRAEPSSGDRLRRRGPFVDGEPGLERSLAHLLYNAGKKSLALALDQSASWELLDRLLPTFDAVIFPLEKTPLAQAFCSESRLRAAHERVSVVDVRLRAGRAQAVTDLIGVAAGGLLYLNGYAEDPPNVPAGKLAYKQTALAAALAALSLILNSRRTGKGGWVTVTMQEAVAWTTIQTANENYWHWHRQRPHRSGAEGLGRAGSRSIFQCRDGHWVSVSIHPPYWDRFVTWTVEATGRHDLTGEEWSEPYYRWEHSDIVTELTDEIASRLTREEMLRQGQEHGVLIGPVNGVAAIARDDHLLARNLFEEVWSPPLRQSVTMLRPPFFSSAYETTLRPAPALGQDSCSILSEHLSLGSAEIDRLIASGIVHASAQAAAPPAAEREEGRDG